jgi:hypothetical protein
MSALPQQETIKQYIADGIEDIYSYTFLVPKDVDIDVFVTPEGQDANDQDDIQPLGVAYTVQDAGVVEGGTVTFLPGFIPPEDSTVTLSRAVEASIDTNYVETRTINGENLDDSFEREMLVIQQNQSKFDDRSLRYQISSFVPDTTNNNIVPILGEGEIWIGSPSGGVAAAFLDENPTCSTLRSELANNSQNTDGAGLVGYYDESRSLPTDVRDQLNSYGSELAGNGADLIGYYDTVKEAETNLSDFLAKGTSGIDILDDISVTLNLITVDAIPAYASLKAGIRIFVEVENTNTDEVVNLNLNGIGPIQVLLNDENGGVGVQGVPVNSILAGKTYEFVYNGSNFICINPSLSVDYTTFPGFLNKFDFPLNNGVYIQSYNKIYGNGSLEDGENIIPINQESYTIIATINYDSSVSGWTPYTIIARPNPPDLLSPITQIDVRIRTIAGAIPTEDVSYSVQVIGLKV